MFDTITPHPATVRVPSSRAFVRFTPLLLAALLGAVSALAVASGLPALRSAFDADPRPLSLDETASAVGVTILHETDVVGSGVRVAVIDSGIADVPQLAGVVERLAPVAAIDDLGHGTHLAGIVNGIAPGATLVDLPAAGANGQPSVAAVTDALSQVVSGAVSVDVVLLAADLTASGADRLEIEALLAALSASDVPVVVSAGNKGTTATGLDWPASSPHVVAVGATGAIGDAWEVPAWSATGNVARVPDVVAPGRSIESLLAPGSAVASDPQAVRVGDHLVRGSGTSQSAAAVAGALALLIEVDPTASLTTLMATLQSTARPIADEPITRQGAGMIDVDAAVTALRGLGDWSGTSWTGTSWTGTSWTGTSWTGTSWTGTSWTGTSWTGTSWTGTSWTGTSWTGTSWTGTSWTGTSWTGTSWTGTSWTGTSWTGTSWTGTSWTGTSWTGTSWTGTSWTGTSWTGTSWTGTSWTGTSWTGTSWTGTSWT